MGSAVVAATVCYLFSTADVAPIRSRDVDAEAVDLDDDPLVAFANCAVNGVERFVN
jgi:hypothetical protein